MTYERLKVKTYDQRLLFFFSEDHNDHTRLNQVLIYWYKSLRRWLYTFFNPYFDIVDEQSVLVNVFV